MSLLDVKSLEEFKDNAYMYRQEYKGFLCSFFRVKERVDYKKKCKETIYSIECKKHLKYKREKIWLYLNGDIEYEELFEILNRKK